MYGTELPFIKDTCLNSLKMHLDMYEILTMDRTVKPPLQSRNKQEVFRADRFVEIWTPCAFRGKIDLYSFSRQGLRHVFWIRVAKVSTEGAKPG